MIIGTYSNPPTESNEYDDIDELLGQLLDNTDNLIDAHHVRNSVYTLWKRIGSQSASASVYYTNLTPTPEKVHGIEVGSTFNNKSMQEMWDMLLYPYIVPLSSISVSPTYKELGNSDLSVNLTWIATKKTNDIASITITGPGLSYNIPGSPFSITQTGNYSASVTLNVDATFSLVVSDSISTITSHVYFKWYNAVYWGTTGAFSLPDMTIVGSKPNWANGASVGSGKSFSTTRNATYDNIDGGGEYLVFAWPTSFGEPTFKVNGLTNTAFTKIGDNITYTNMYGYNNQYDVWITNTAQNSPIDSFIIS